MAQTIKPFRQCWMPLTEALNLRELRGQVFQPLIFFGLGPGDVLVEPGLNLGLAQHLEHLRQSEGCLISEPAHTQQRRRCLAGIANLRVTELASSKMLTFAHDHPHP